jgi:DNA-binding transcriptional regulator YiaG
LSNHPNRSRRKPGFQPTPEDIAQLRAAMGLTQSEFGDLLYTSLRQVQDWEGGQRRMRGLVWEYANLLRESPAVLAARSAWLARHVA